MEWWLSVDSSLSATTLEQFQLLSFVCQGFLIPLPWRAFWPLLIFNCGVCICILYNSCGFDVWREKIQHFPSPPYLNWKLSSNLCMPSIWECYIILHYHTVGFSRKFSLTFNPNSISIKLYSLGPKSFLYFCNKYRISNLKITSCSPYYFSSPGQTYAIALKNSWPDI